MKVCENCNAMHPTTARFCMSCGRRLADEPGELEEREEREAREKKEEPDTGGSGFRMAGMSAFTLSIMGSLLLSVILMAVFRLPVFIMAAFLPLLWFRRKE